VAMNDLHNTYRTRKPLFPKGFLNFLQIGAVALCTVLRLMAGQTDSQQKAASAPPVNKQASSVEAMLASVDKQRAAVKAQAGTAAAPSSDTFFTTPWTTPATIPVPAVVPSCTAMPEADLKPLIDESAKAQDLKPELIHAVIRRESDSYPCAVSEKGAVGLMQLMPDVARQFGADPLDPKQNVQAGSRYLKQLMSRYKGDLKLALAAYNAGPQLVDAQNKVPDIPETTSYVEAILKDLKEPASPNP
jgi:soluble lytic murein transglycosylase-like protein